MAKNRKYIIGSGIAISPEKDMALLKKMSKQGWHFSGTWIWWYQFEKGEPADYDYASNMESKITKDMIALYEESGWLPIVACDGMQIFRAVEGATPIFSDLDSEIEALEEIKRNTIKSAIIWSIALILVMMARFVVPDAWNLLGIALTILSVFIAFPSATQIISFFGIKKLIKNKKRQSNKM